MSNTNYDATVDGKFETPFEKALHQTIQSPDKNRGFISDGTITCKYDEFPAVFQKIDAFLEESGVSSHQCSIFRCGNSLPEALLLARMLCRKSSFFLLPRSGGKGQAFLEDLILPEFCQYKLTVDTGKLTDGIDIHDPAAYISVEPNPQYKSNPFEAGSVFLKTSGSTAEPKLVKHTNENLYRNGLNCVERFELVRGDRVMIPVPLYHMYGFGAAFLPAIIAGASVHLLENTNIIKYLEGENQFKPNISFMTPVLCEMSTRTRKGSYPYRAVVTAGDRINKTAFETFEQRFGRLVNLYGSTELGAIATSNLSDPLDTRSDGIVQPMPGVDIRLKGTGVSGLVCIHDSGFETYVDKHGTPIPPDPRTGFDTKDLAKIIDPQRFKVVGRTGNSINRNGILVAFSEVESLMEQGIEDVQYAIVVTNEEESARGRKLAAYCQLKPRTGAHSTGKDIRSRCFDIMLRHMVPDKVVLMEEIPRLPNGKFDRKKLANLS